MASSVQRGSHRTVRIKRTVNNRQFGTKLARGSQRTKSRRRVLDPLRSKRVKRPAQGYGSSSNRF
jgi:hypothetical protein